MAKKLSEKKAQLMLAEKQVRGKRLTQKQVRFFQAIAHGAKMKKNK